MSNSRRKRSQSLWVVYCDKVRAIRGRTAFQVERFDMRTSPSVAGEELVHRIQPHHAKMMSGSGGWAVFFISPRD
jgi:hypothetical protein